MIKQKSTQGTGPALVQEDAIVKVLSGHDHVIDCIAWGNPDVAKIIESSHYSLGTMNELEHGENDENGAVEELK